MVLKLLFEQEFEQKFREVAMKKYGFTKGALKQAGQEALTQWVQDQQSELPQLKNPLNAIDGLMKHLRGKCTAVELQHESAKLWTKQK